MRRSCLICIAAIVGSLHALSSNISLGQQTVFPTDQWVTSTPESVLVDPQALNEALNYVRYAGSPGTDEMVIIRNGRLILEGIASERAHHTWSVTKSFATTMLGLAIDDGLVTLDTLVKDFVPSVGAIYPEMTLRHAATHTSGYLAQGETYFAHGSLGVDPFTPGPPLFSPPGSQFAYNQTPLTQMMNVLTRAAGEPMQDLFQRRIGDPIGIENGNWDWGHYVTDDGLAVDGGGGYPGKGLVISASDLARLGHLYSNGGSWEGQQLLSAGWVHDATRQQAPSDIPRHPKSFAPGDYGFGWWVTDRMFAALGHENNVLLVWPDADLVVARLGTNVKNVSWLYTVANRFYESLDTEAVWDGKGDGVWEDISMQSGKSRWIGPNETELVIYPDKHPGSVTIRTDTVTTESDHQVNVLTVDKGTLLLSDSVLTVNSYLQLLDGTIRINDDSSQLMVNQALQMTNGATLQFTLVSDRDLPYCQIPIHSIHGGTLSLSLGQDPSSFVGQTFNLFDWKRFVGFRPGRFDRIDIPPSTQWDLENLYTTGEVTLLAVPEPSVLVMLPAGLLAIGLRRRRSLP